MTTHRATRRRHPALLLIPLLLAAAGCTAGGDTGGAPATKPAIAIPDPGGSFDIPSRVASIPAIHVEVKARGHGLHARAGDTCAVHYTGRLLDGTQFDSSRGGLPFEFPLGQGAVIRGWDIVVAHMTVGDRFVVRIPAQLAYGHVGSPPVIPPDADLIFDMELVRVR